MLIIVENDVLKAANEVPVCVHPQRKRKAALEKEKKETEEREHM